MIPKHVTCPSCDLAVVRIRTEAVPGRDEHQRVYEHDGGSVCRPLCTEEAHSLRCSDCGRDVPFTVHVSPAIRRTAGELRCACGSRWRLEGMPSGVRLYVEAA
jgi:hypothetical protein